MEPLAAAQRIVASHVVDARGALLAGSSLSAARTPTSDLDIVVFVGHDDEAYRATLDECGWITELFVHSPSSFHYFTRLESTRRYCTLTRMCAEGVEILSVGGTVDGYRKRARDILEAGPEPLSDGELAQRRYVVTDLLDDFVGTTSSRELVFVVAALVTATSELELSAHRQWLATAKALERQLERWRPTLAADLAEGATLALSTNEREPLRATVSSVLDGVGGSLRAGYHQSAPGDARR